MERFEEILGTYEEKVKPYQEKKEIISSQITEIRNQGLDSSTLLRHKVLSRRLEEAIIDKDEKKAQALRRELAEINEASDQIKEAKARIPALENEIKAIDAEIFTVGKGLLSEAVSTALKQQNQKLIEAADLHDSILQRLSEFRRQIGDMGLGGGVDYLFKVNLLQSRDVILRLQNWINLPGHE